MKRLRWILALSWLALAPESLRACSACFGRSDSTLAQGMNMGILALLIVVMGVLSGFAAFTIFLVRRAALHSELPPANDDDSTKP